MKKVNLDEEDNNSENSLTAEEDSHRVVISKETNDSLKNLVLLTNEGFSGGEVNKSNIADYIIATYAKTFNESDVKSLRNLHFDEKKVLRALLRKSGNELDLPEEVKRAIREHAGLFDSPKKRNSRNSANLSTDKNVDNVEN